ncbi:MAG: bifunctional isocitrate dehydrogenase kinase/phosphatase [Chromatiales bacterium]|jgi:isocitrate dehydrogenase kinase/phosphatase|nr:bifunctional isocitrate dehydrogenase kinase/phosphatase [Chromatiales bacterium]MDX9767857.1 bifunctional isocitrate dehydrogenase kinase/phosphatase [Ectothiorhodospiraceae bacterium]
MTQAEPIPRAEQIARAILTGFDRHYALSQEITSGARERFERADWEAVRTASSTRLSFYDDRVCETVDKVRKAFAIDGLDEGLWQDVKFVYAEMLEPHSRPELAETFYNSVFCKLFDRSYYNNDKIFVESQADRAQLAAHYRGFISFHARDGGLESTAWEILSAFYFSVPYEDVARDARSIASALRERSPILRELPEALDGLRIDVLESPFFRNKGAYLIGRVVYGDDVHPFIVPLLNDERGGIHADTLLTQEEEAEAVFSFARAYFFVKTPVPAATVAFLQSIMPSKPLSELYMSIGLHKQAKNEFYRDFLHHLAASDDRFTVAPGTRGLVMVVFTLPSYPFVFKVIRDRFPPQKDVTPELVKKRYLQVKMHDRVGRMADTMEFSDVAFPLARFEPELLEELEREIPSQLEREGDVLFIRHLYIEKRMMPLDLYLKQAVEEEGFAALDDWALAIRQLMAANIFPGDLLFKNFGLTCHGKIVFYDYDEICYLTECNFRHIPPAPHPEDELRSEPWYAVGPYDVFPEEFPTFLTTDPKLRRRLRERHPDLFDHHYWQARQQDIRRGVYGDVFPYPQELRFVREAQRGPRRLSAA